MNLQNRAVKLVQKKYKISLQCLGYIGPDNYRQLIFDLGYLNLLTEDEARYIIVDIAAILLEEINNNEEIRPYLSQYPYLAENLSLTIFPKNSNYRSPEPPDLIMIDFDYGKITYYTDSENEHTVYQTVNSETYEEALEKLREQGRDIPEYFKNWKPEDKK